MNSKVLLVLLIGLLYMVLMVAIGWYSQRKTDLTSEEYFLASRTIRGFFLFCAVIGTNLSGFVMLGMPGASYHNGFGMFGLIAGSFAIGFTTFYFGVRVWILGKKFGYGTPCELYGDRFNSNAVSLIMFIIFAIYTLPYVVIGQVGAGAGLETFTDGLIPYWLGSLIVTIVVGYYVWGGGMRGTVYTNVAQVIIFTLFFILAIFMVANHAGGFQTITERLLTERPELLQRSGVPTFSWKIWFSQWLLFFFVVFSFPHIFVRLLAARSSDTLRQNSIMYPVGASLIYIMAVTLGVWGAILIPGLEGSASDNIIFMMTFEFLPIWMSGVALTGLFAMIMSTMDAQLLTMSNLFINDILKKYFAKLDEGKSVAYGRLFVIILLALSYIVSLIRPASVFDIAELSFTGTTVMIPIMVAAIYWRRLNRWGAICGLVAGAIVVPIYFFTDWLPSFGFLPIVPAFIIATITMVIATYLTKPEYHVADRQLKVFKDYYTSIDSPVDIKEKPVDVT